MDEHFWRRALLYLAVIACLGRLSLTMKISLHPPSIVAGLTKNATIKCITDDMFDGGKMQHWWVRLTRETPDGWEIMHEANMFGAKVNTAEGIHTDQGMQHQGRRSYVEIKWPLTIMDTYGVYRCQAAMNKDFTEMEVRTSEKMNVKENISLNIITDIWGGIAKDPSKCVSNIDNGSPKTFLDIRMDEFSRQLQLYLRDTTWFGGNYALLMTDTGCPLSFKHFPSMLKFHEESSERDSCLQSEKPMHLSKPLRVRSSDQCFVNIRFCESDEGDKSHEWPDGKYCINQIHKKPCPAGFAESGLEQIDLEDIRTSVVYEGHVAWGNEAFSFIGFCCKDTGSVETAIRIPTGRPFYLYRCGGTCQQVLGMNVMEEYVDIDTEDEKINDDTRGRLTPDVDMEIDEPIRIHLCYYSKKPQNPTM